MKSLTTALIIIFSIMPTVSVGQQNPSRTKAVPIELTRENEFVVKMMDVIDKSGRKVTHYSEINAFKAKEKQIIFKRANGRLKKVPAGDVRRISFVRLRQGVLTGKSQNLRVIAWNGTIAVFEIGYQDVKIKDGYLWLDGQDFAKYFNDSGTLRSNSSEWSDKFYAFWNRKKTENPKEFAAHFDYQNGKATISRKMASEYCPSCLKTEILSIQMDHETETMRLRCKDFFYDRYME